MRLNLELLPYRLAVARLDAAAVVPGWLSGAFTSVSRTPDELSVICDSDAVPGDVAARRNWRCVRVRGSIPFDEVGILAALADPLRDAGIPIFVISTFDTDYVLVDEGHLSAARRVLEGAGHSVVVVDR